MIENKEEVQIHQKLLVLSRSKVDKFLSQLPRDTLVLPLRIHILGLMPVTEKPGQLTHREEAPFRLVDCALKALQKVIII